MKYDFETLVDRSACGSEKWNAIKRVKPNAAPGTVPLSIADMEFKNAPEITDGLKDYLDSHILGYTMATDEYRSAVCDWLERRHSWKIEPEWISVSSGVVPTLYMLVDALSERDDGVIVMPPVYYPFFSAVTMNGRRVVRCPLVNRDGLYGMDYDLLEKLAAEKSNRLLIFCNPHNPVGRVWTHEELEKAGKICRENGVVVISDEIHADIIMPGNRHCGFAQASDSPQNVVTCTAPSKTFNLAAMQTSNIIISDEDMRTKFNAVKAKNCAESLNALGFEACRLAYTKGEPWMNEMISVIAENYEFARGYLAEKLPRTVVSPLEGTYLMWIDCRFSGFSNKELERRMIENDLFLDEGYVFGDEGSGFERINLACPKRVLRSAMERFVRALS